MGTIAENIVRIKERIYNRAIKVGRRPEEITLLAITKTVDSALIKEAVAAGITFFGENYVQEAQAKIAQVGAGVIWHLVGHLQTNKVKQSIPLFSMIHSVDSARLAQEISRRAMQQGKRIEVLIQVDIAGEETKTGVAPEALPPLLEEVSQLEGIHLRGLMTMPPYFQDPEKARPFFRELRELRDRLRPSLTEPDFFDHLSMGMSSDFDVAVEEGATILRIGTAIFGERQ